MSNVTLVIGGRHFTVACAEGEEAHIEQLGGMIDEKLTALGNASSFSESRMLLYSALLLADELHEIRSTGTASPEAGTLGDGAVQRLEGIASQLEKLADHLEAHPSLT